ncbi:anti-anti-sigma factor [Catenulispora sp. GP43]|uniref:STAS domain-containing protein n=1 Tax=Catenulispora sp. GP43 TaxID=3156263 RepID=UPI003519A3D2
MSGDVDMSTRQQLAQTLEPLVAAGDVVLDCSQVAFFDSMGLRVAVTMMQQAAQLPRHSRWCPRGRCAGCWSWPG